MYNNKRAKTLQELYEKEVLDTPWFRTNQRKMVNEAFDLAINAIKRTTNTEGPQMTNKEAITILLNATFSKECQGDKDLKAAYHMAIEALCRDDYNQPRDMVAPIFEYCPICGVNMRKEA